MIKDPVAAREGSQWPAELVALYSAERTQLVRAAFLVCGSVAAAEDAVHDAVSRVAGRWDQVESGRSYVYVAAVNAARDSARRDERSLRLFTSRRALEPGDDFTKVQTLRAPGARVGTRTLAAVLVVVLAVAVVVALVIGRRGHTPRVETPTPKWTSIAPFPVLARSDQSAVFTGQDVIVWGGRADSVGNIAPGNVPHSPPYAQGDGAAYDLATGSWGVLPRAPIGARYGAVAVWTGSEMVVVGGMRDGTGPSGGIEFLQDGAAYDPAHRRWQRITDAPGCPAFGTWTGKELIVGGTCANTTRAFVMAAYDPARDAWTVLPSFPLTRQLVSAGGRVFAWDAVTKRGAVLDEHARRWVSLPPLDTDLQVGSFITAYRGRLAVAGYVQKPSENFDRATIDLLDLGRGTWRHYEAKGVTPMIDGSEIASDASAIVWSSGVDVTTFATLAGGRSVWHSIGESALDVGGTEEALVPIGHGRFFIVGGLLASNSAGQPNRPTPLGAILQLPRAG